MTCVCVCVCGRRRMEKGAENRYENLWQVMLHLLCLCLACISLERAKISILISHNLWILIKSILRFCENNSSLLHHNIENFLLIMPFLALLGLPQPLLEKAKQKHEICFPLLSALHIFTTCFVLLRLQRFIVLLT